MLQRHQEKELLRFLAAGSVDDGKSTLIGRLLYDSNGLYEDHLRAVQKDSDRWGHAGGELDLSLLTDGLKAEREQGITIDVAFRYFTTARRKFIIADTPGHVQYTRNMVTGASTCDLAIILIDAQHGMLAQSRRHSYIASLLGLKHLVVAVNKMDLVDYRQDVFDRIESEYSHFAAALGISDIHFMPISAFKGDNVVWLSERMPWYQGPPLLTYLETVHIAGDRNLTDFRFPVQLVLRPNEGFRGLAGTVASGVVRPGDSVVVLPSGTPTRVRALVTRDGDLDEAHESCAVCITLEDDVDVGRGDMLVHPHNQPLVERDMDAMLVWMDERPLEVGASYWLKHTTSMVPATITGLRYRVDVDSLEPRAAESLTLNDVGCVTLSVSRPIFYDPYRLNRATGAFILIDRTTNATSGAGMIQSRHPKDLVDRSLLIAHPREVTAAMRSGRLHHKPAVIWFTGLPRSGKSPLAYRLERRLFELGCGVYAVGGGALRTGLNADLTFAVDDRSENVRRLAELARLLTDAGLIAICAVVSPYRIDRDKARRLVGEDRFLEIYCSAPVEVCETRDPEGLYLRARQGDIKSFTGVTAPYEAPEHPDADIRIDSAPIDDLVTRLIDLLRTRGILT